MEEVFLIVVDDDLLNGSVELLEAQASTTEDLSTSHPGAQSAEALPPERRLAFRRRALLDLAEAIATPESLGESGGAVGILSERNVASDLSTGESDVRPPIDKVEGVEVLEGIGALVVHADKDKVDALRGSFGLTVLENVEIPLPVIEGKEKETSSEGLGVEPDEDWHLEAIGLSSGEAGGSGILVGILDTGIDASHSEFAGKTIHFREFDKVGRVVSSTPRDAGDHGTHVSSIATGLRQGVAPDADLAVAAVLTYPNAQGVMSGYLVQIATGLDWLVKTRFNKGEIGVDIVNASLGGSGFSSYLSAGVRAGLAAGIPMIASIGNAGRKGPGHHGSPGNYSDTMGVGASDLNDQVADFSDWADAGPPDGPRYPVPNICAPGVDVMAAVPGGQFRRKSGTSMAAPVVTGIAARRMSDNLSMRRHPRALFLSLLSSVSPVNPHPTNGNRGGVGRIHA